MIELSIILVNYKTPQLLANCLKSIKLTIKNVCRYEIIVVDNCSNDNSEEIIKGLFPDVIWIQKEENDGFGRANNVGIKKSNGEFLLLLNTDVIILENTINTAIETIRKDEKIGALGIGLLNEDGSDQNAVYYCDGEKGAIKDLLRKNLFVDYFWRDKLVSTDIQAIQGAFMLMPKKMLDEVGLFDSDFFMYFEEIDLCRRIKKGGYEIVYLNELKAFHLNGSSSTDKDWIFKQKYLSDALLRFKSLGFVKYMLYHSIYLFNTITNFSAMWLLDKNYRYSFLKEQRYYFSNYFYYFIIPFLYKRCVGSGKRLLKKRLDKSC